VPVAASGKVLSEDLPDCAEGKIPGPIIGFLASKPADIARPINAADRGAESPVKAGGSPAFRRIRINDRRNSAAAKSEFYLRLVVVERLITAPGSLEIGLFDWRAEFCDESLHRDHLNLCGKQRELCKRAMTI
jgi:hypothetical protein